jgi:amino-acid N-acetyltransferase
MHKKRKITMDTITVRKAVPEDAAAIQEVLDHYASEERLLRRSRDEIIENIRDFFVALHEGLVCGCCALKIYSDTLAEIRSLAVREGDQHQGAGAALMDACEQEALSFGIRDVFALTYIPDFFKKRGYGIAAKEIFPQKIWRDCFKCSQFPDCRETAVLKVIR